MNQDSNLNNMTNIGLEQENTFKFWIKQIVTLFLPFLVVYSELKKKYSRKLAIINSIIGLIIFIIFWNGIFSDNTFKTENNQLKENLIIKNEKIDKQAEKINELSELSKLTDKQKADKKAKEKADKERKAEQAKLIEEKEEKAKIKENYQSWINKQFSVWNGNCYVMEDEIKNVLNNPDSYKFVSNKYWEQDDYKSIIVKITFTCENGLGGTVKNVAHGKIIYDKNVSPTQSRIEDFELIQ